MKKKSAANAPSLFDLLDLEERKENGEPCPHTRERKTYTIWPNEDFERMTWTCEECGNVRGRC